MFYHSKYDTENRGSNDECGRLNHQENMDERDMDGETAGETQSSNP